MRERILRIDRREVRERLTGSMPRTRWLSRLVSIKAALGENLRIETRGVRQERERERERERVEVRGGKRKNV